MLMLGFLLFALPDLADAQSPSYVGEWGRFAGGAGQFRYPRGVAVGPTGDVYVADTENHRVQHFTAVGAFVKQWGQFGTEGYQFRSPYGIGVGSDGSVYVADTGNYLLKKFNDYGALVWSYGGFLNRFRTMAGVGVAPSGVVLASVPSNNLIQKVSQDGDYLGYVTAGFGSIDYPTGIAMTANGDVFVAEQFKHWSFDRAPVEPYFCSGACSTRRTASSNNRLASPSTALVSYTCSNAQAIACRS